jgi:hypothetical protein
VGKPDGKRSIGRYMFRWVDIGIRIFKVWDGGGAWTGLMWRRIGSVGWRL